MLFRSPTFFFFTNFEKNIFSCKLYRDFVFAYLRFNIIHRVLRQNIFLFFLYFFSTCIMKYKRAKDESPFAIAPRGRFGNAGTYAVHFLWPASSSIPNFALSADLYMHICARWFFYLIFFFYTNVLWNYTPEHHIMRKIAFFILYEIFLSIFFILSYRKCMHYYACRYKFCDFSFSFFFF